MKLAATRTIPAGVIALLAFSTVLTACMFGGGSDQPQENSQLVDTGQSQSGNQVAGATSPTRPTAPRSAATGTPVAGSAANVSVSPSEVEIGGLTISMSVGPAVRMAAAGTTSGAPTPQTSQGGVARQETVLGDQMLRVTKNLDAAQAPPPDPKEAQGDFVRHVEVQVKDKVTGQMVPYLTVTMDILRDGRPVQYEQALVPLIAAGANPDQLHYGNNVAFPGKGRYQLFVRMPGATTTSGTAPYAQFDLSIE